MSAFNYGSFQTTKHRISAKDKLKMFINETQFYLKNRVKKKSREKS